MINIIQFPQDTHFIKPLSLIGLGVFIHELITYPLDRIVTRIIAKSPIKQISIQEKFLEIYKKELWKGLYKGFRTSLDRNLIQNLSHYFSFQYFFLRYGIEFNEIKERIEVKDQPYLKFCDNANFYGIAFGSSVISALLSQPNNTISLKLQCEQLGLPKRKYWDNMTHLEEIMKYHKNSFAIALTPGFQTKVLLLFLQLITEINLLQYLLRSSGYLFINKKEQQGLIQEKNKHFYGAIAISLFTPVVFHPLNFLQKRYAMRKLLNMKPLMLNGMLQRDIPKFSVVFSGLGAETFRYSTRSIFLFYLFWNSADQSGLY